MNERNTWRNLAGYGLLSFLGEGMRFFLTFFTISYITEGVGLDIPQAGIFLGGAGFIRLLLVLFAPFLAMLIDRAGRNFDNRKKMLLFAALIWAGMQVLLFLDLGLRGPVFKIIYFLLILAQEVAHTIYRLAFLTVVPALSFDAKKREKLYGIGGAATALQMFVFIFFSGNLYALFQKAMPGSLGFFVLTLLYSLLFVLTQIAACFLLRQAASDSDMQTQIPPSRSFSYAYKNEQLMILLPAFFMLFLAMGLTNGVVSTHFEIILVPPIHSTAMFAFVAGTQVLSFLLFPLVTHFLARTQQLQLATAILVIGYVAFFFSPNHLVPIIMSCVLIFVGQAAMQVVLFSMFADTLDYGEWKHRSRSDFASASLIYMVISAGAGLAGMAIPFVLQIAYGMRLEGSGALSYKGTWIIKIVILVLPALLVGGLFLLLQSKYKIDEAMAARVREETQPNLVATANSLESYHEKRW